MFRAFLSLSGSRNFSGSSFEEGADQEILIPPSEEDASCLLDFGGFGNIRREHGLNRLEKGRTS